ncbi:UDP-3-O-(3-hydroxymyristoyl)glucosamine N-acyltransferase [Pseudoroseicyclus tamaricis]|uniref:UDP-3-O-(3-hydroxymyristoyl)glucosamine N-acyltransferase n=1 Tax=Pseudoroseicyclus tamaricis TaxID=2705421 RepID=A0A6B2JIE2_9RHOB|nr:UDP-3-O-(3-hydroxymyristoyl)glucosamine N-acyltransferase [Pseudoroseicyclus tamaricis]NDV01141.1 UDP-3-O-(3-hydroxymyristoyl)glucosamine N-acyltransferase [Pseudoroseicyclus tamaricis]
MPTLAEIARALSTEVKGDGSLSVDRAAEPAEAGPRDLAIALSPKWAESLPKGRAEAALLWDGADWQAMGLKGAITAPRGRLAMASLSAVLDPGHGMGEGIDETARLGEGVELGAGVGIGPFSVIGAGARLGEGVRIGAHVTIAAGAVIGAGTVIHPGVRVGPNVRLGARCILHPNAVIGADGFSFTTAEPTHQELSRETMGEGEPPVMADPSWHKIHSLGGVELGDDVDIGAGTAVDSGTIRATRIGDGAKIDNLCHIAHNVIVGRHCLFAAQTGIAGSTTIGDRTVIGGKGGVADNLTIGADVVLGGASIVLSNVPAGRVMLGYPAMPLARQVESYKALRRLPRILARLSGTGS